MVAALADKYLYLDTWRHGDVEVAEHMLAVLILGGLAQEGQKSSVLFTAVSHLGHTNRGEYFTCRLETTLRTLAVDSDLHRDGKSVVSEGLEAEAARLLGGFSHRQEIS